MGKYLILDKSVFEATSTSKLGKFSQNHFLILPDVLYYECATTDTNKERLLDRFRSVILSGAYICPNCIDIIKNESKNLSPYGFIVDLGEVQEVRKTFHLNSRPYSPHHAQEKLEDELDMAKMLHDSADDYLKKIATEQPDLLSEIRKFDNSKKGRFERFRAWAKNVDSQDIHWASRKQLKGVTHCHDKYCLSDEWISWQFLRLTLTFRM